MKCVGQYVKPTINVADYIMCFIWISAGERLGERGEDGLVKPI